MKEIRLATWEDFEAAISCLIREVDKKREKSPTHVSELLFRGQKHASWRLQTTLERYTKEKHSRRSYHRIMTAVKPIVESLTGRTWNLASGEDSHVSASGDRHGDGKEWFRIHTPRPPVGYEFMIYLRHHGFPSPLLDWTRSPYVASFFAFCSNESSDDPDIAIYSYVEFFGDGKAGAVGEPRIVHLGPYVATHRRHFSQQSEYTICEKYNGEEYVHSDHESVPKYYGGEQDVITKYIIPRTERSKAMKKLHLINITSYSLFGNEEGLMETLAYQEIERKG